MWNTKPKFEKKNKKANESVIVDENNGTREKLLG